MKRYDFDWTSKAFEHEEKGIEAADYLAIKALGVAYKHFLVPMSDYDLAGWHKHDHYRHNISELEENEGDKVWIKPWITGHWLEGKECIFRFEPDELMEEALEEIDWAGLNDWEHKHKRGAVFGIYLTVAREKEDWDAVFSFRLDDRPGADKLHDLPVRQALCLAINDEDGKLEGWLDWAYKQSA